MEFLTKLKLKRYLLAYSLKSMPIVYILVLGIVGILFMPISFAENSTAWIGGYILAPILCAFVLKNILRDAAAVNRQLKSFEEQGELDAVVKDFQGSDKTIGGNLMVGERYLFGKGSMRVLPYGSIRSVHMESAERQGKHARDLVCEDVTGDTFVVCQLDPMGKSHTELDTIYRKILKKNPAAETGL